MEAKIAIAN